MIDLRGTNRWLLISLALNLFLMGYVVAVLMRPQEMPLPPPPPPPPAMMLERMSQDLSPEGQVVLRELIAAHGDRLEELHAAMNSARLHAREVFAQEPFDEAAFRTASAAGFDAAQEFFRAVEDVLEQAGTRLSADDRQRLRILGPPGPPR